MAADRLKARLPTQDLGNLLQQFTTELQSDAAQNCSPGERSVNMWLTAPTGKTVVQWVNSNKATTEQTGVKEHPSYQAVLNSALPRLRCCADQGQKATCAVHEAGNTTLADLLWVLTDGIFEHVPASVVHFSLALTVRAAVCNNASSADSSNSSDTAGIPTFAHFLGEWHEQEVAGEASWAGSGVWELHSQPYVLLYRLIY